MVSEEIDDDKEKKEEGDTHFVSGRSGHDESGSGKRSGEGSGGEGGDALEGSDHVKRSVGPDRPFSIRTSFSHSICHTSIRPPRLEFTSKRRDIR